MVRENIENQSQESKKRVELEADTLLKKLQKVIDNHKEALFQEIDSSAKKKLDDMQKICDSLPSESDVESVVSQVKEAAHKSPLFTKIDEMTEIHQRALEIDKNLRAFERVSSGKNLPQFSVCSTEDPDLIAAELSNILKVDFTAFVVGLTVYDDGSAAEERRFGDACQEGDLQGVKDILDRNRQLHGCNNYIVNCEVKGIFNSLSPLGLAASSGNLALVRFLVEEAGANLYSVETYFANGYASHNSSIEADHLGVFKYLLEKDPDLLKFVDAKQNTLLHWAAKSGLVDVIGFLVKEKGLDVNARNNNGETPLLKAASHPPAMKTLIELGAAVDVVSKTGSSIASLLAESGDLDTFKFIHNLSPRFTVSGDSQRKSPLYFAALAGHSNLVAYILENCTHEFTNSGDDKGEAREKILEHVVSSGRLKILELLANRGCVKLDQKFADGSTLLHWASVEGRSRTVRFLLKRFPDMLIERNDRGQRAIDCCMQEDYCYDIVRYLASCHQYFENFS